MMPSKGDRPAGKLLKAKRSALTEARRARIRMIVLRTAAGRAEISAVAAAADMRDVDHLPVITGLLPPKAKVKRKRSSAIAVELEHADEDFLGRMRGQVIDHAVEAAAKEMPSKPRKDPKPPKKPRSKRGQYRCRKCGELGHVSRNPKCPARKIGAPALIRTATADAAASTPP